MAELDKVSALVGRRSNMRAQELTIAPDESGVYFPFGYDGYFAYTDIDNGGLKFLRICVLRGPSENSQHVYIGSFKLLKERIRESDMVFMFRFNRELHESIIPEISYIIDWLTPVTRRDIARDKQRYLSAMERLTVPRLAIDVHDVISEGTSDAVDYY